MTTTPVQLWKGSRFSIERYQGRLPGSVIFRLVGPFTARDMYGSLTPDALRNLFESEKTPAGEVVSANILDLSEVPYMDSAGIGMIVSHFVRCQGKGIRMVAAGVSPRVLQLFNVTKVDSIVPMAPTVEAAEAN